MRTLVRLPLFFFFCFLLSLPIANAQTAEKSAVSAVAAKILTVDYGSPNDLDLERGFGLEIAYQRIFGKYIGIALPIQVQIANVPGVMNNIDILNFDGLLHLYPLKSTSRFSPYLLGGAGLSVEDLETAGLQFPVGGGLNVRLGESGFVTLQGAYRLASAELRDNYQWGLGYTYRFNRQDADGDGVSDGMDRCPDVPGLPALGGCPDRDGDGLADVDDLCPDVAGTIATQGCPDTDGDGIVDNQDDCPTEAGPLRGCPDQDEDGVADKDDACPTIAGPVADAGCPDTDGDGVHDGVDQCPDTVGPRENNGCPLSDRDNDGLADDLDQCPDAAGPTATRGCPDSDGDGVADKDDKCPDVAGPYLGCPDTDGDGIHDGEDRCPDEAGILSNKGCPEIKEETKEVLDLAMRAVRFETGSARLKPESNQILDQIVEITEQYPAFSLIISGHTDNVGTEANNQLLSESRAKACYQYLVAKGVAARRMSYAGYGESAPIADNDTSSGRRLNRRVEFDLIVR